MNIKKKLGQFFTKEDVANFMVKWATDHNPNSVLDPAAGQGVFVKLSQQYCPQASITAYEFDTNMINIYKKNIRFKTNLINADYLTDSNDKKYDSIICNPPYNKFQLIDNREELINKFEVDYHIKLSGYSNLYIYFLIKSINQLSKGGRCCYIIPYEFLNAGYGKVIKKYFIEKKIVKSIIKFDNKLNLFDDAITTSCILMIENKTHDKIELVNVENLEGTNNATVIQYDYDKLKCDEKWLSYFSKKEEENKYNNLIQLKDFAKVKRGIATGNNNFFALNEEKIKKLKLSEDVCVPCITKAPDVMGIVFRKKEFAELTEKNKKVFIFDGTKAKTQNDFDYIKFGEENNFNKSYLTSHRYPWYSIENRTPAPILLSVFSRGKLKVVRNEAKVKNLTTFHGLYFDETVSEGDINVMFCYLLTPIAQKIIYNNRREYGDGLEKFEPNDLNDSLVIDINVISDLDKQSITNIYNLFGTEDEATLINQLNNIFEKYLLIS